LTALLVQFSVGFLLALAISTAALAARSLTRGGAAAAVPLGTAVYGFGGWQAAVLLVTFFLSSSLLERLVVPLEKRPLGQYAKGGPRDAGQVLANGLVAVVSIAAAHFYPQATWTWLAFAGSLAVVTADTWATELGILSNAEPRLITRLNVIVPAGTSGAVSLAGTLATALGAALIGLLAAGLASLPASAIAFAVTIGGVMGSLLDSLLGATVQAQYVCTSEHTTTEQHPRHACGSPTVHCRGWRWLNNDLVNLSSAVFGALVCSLLCVAVS